MHLIKPLLFLLQPYLTSACVIFFYMKELNEILLLSCQTLCPIALLQMTAKWERKIWVIDKKFNLYCHITNIHL